MAGSKEQWEKYLENIEFTLPSDGISAPEQEKEKSEPDPTSQKKVFLQKIISEIWIYTDLEGKAFAQKGIQDIYVLGEMTIEEAMKIIGDQQNKKKRNR